MERNRLVQELHNKRVVVDGKHIFLENSQFCPNLIPEVSVKHVAENKDPYFRQTDEVQESESEEAKRPDPGLPRGSVLTGLDPVTPSKHEADLHLIEVGSAVPKDISEKLNSIHKANETVFDGNLEGGYNGSSGNFEVDFNFTGGVPPTPDYHGTPPYNLSKDDILMQAKIDSLEKQGVVVKVADTNIVPKYAAPSMLTLKSKAKTLPPGEYEKLSYIGQIEVQSIHIVSQQVK